LLCMIVALAMKLSTPRLVFPPEAVAVTLIIVGFDELKLSTAMLAEAPEAMTLTLVISLQCPDAKRRISEANRRRPQAEAPCGRMPRTMRAARWVESVPGTPPGTRSRRSPLQAVERPGTLGDQVFAPLGKEAQHLRSSSGSTVGNRSLRQAASAVARASSPSFLRALPVESGLARTRRCPSLP
jgi:hypothetical protein